MSARTHPEDGPFVEPILGQRLDALVEPIVGLVDLTGLPLDVGQDLIERRRLGVLLDPVLELSAGRLDIALRHGDPRRGQEHVGIVGGQFERLGPRRMRG